jgi:5-methylcytosine-specific restriction endonuclease McrA
MSILSKQIVVKLNRSWVGFDVVSVEKSIGFLTSEDPNTGERPGMAIDFETAVDENGEHVLVRAQPVTWEEWIKLPVREQDLAIGIGNDPVTGAPRQIRCPLVVICARYDKIPEKRPRLSTGAIWERDGGICQYTGEKVSRATGDIDHVVPRDRGGKDTWENLVVSKKELNRRKSNKLNREVGLKLIRRPVAPKPTVKVLKAADAKHPTQVPFLLK